MNIKEKVLLFIPYQDTDNYYSDGIMTREYAMLYSLYNEGYKKIINVKKPRTWLDSKKYVVNESNYPDGTIEHLIKKELDLSNTVQYLPPISINQILKRRGWWHNGYQKTISLLEKELDHDRYEYLIYSDNPFAVELLRHLKEKGCFLYFDIMDNFAIHPSFNESERKNALKQYKEIFKFADVISANSEQTCVFMKKYTEKTIYLVKNGVFAKNEISGISEIEQIKIIESEKKAYKKCVGYIGKLGTRLDAGLIKEVSQSLPNTLFVFVGGYLKGQINTKLIELFDGKNNVLHVASVPSAYVYSVLNQFDILSIPHSVGKNENGGDPLKLYQYLTRKKPIITTPILGVSEFEKYIKISDSVNEWVKYIENTPELTDFAEVNNFTWANRLKPVMEVIKNG